MDAVNKRYMEVSNIQLELEENSITIRTNILQGVLTVKTFHGPDCYLRLLSFIREVFSKDNIINATIFLK
jgi:hypothetical protein